MVKRGKEEKEMKETDLLLENFIALQKKLVETVKDLKELKQGVSELVTIFKRAEEELKHDKNISFAPKIEEKLDKLLEQNKAIAEGVIAIGENLQKVGEERIKRRELEEKKIEKKEKAEEEEKSGEDEYDLEPLPEFNF
ncbi:MAG: hypothetical protein QXW65_00720 [Candidatus Pacearchaeota archaeon]